MKIFSKYDLPKLLLEHDVKCGIELGVATGSNSYYLLTNYNFKKFYGVDSYVDEGWNVEVYKKWLKKSQEFKNYTLLRTTFDEALDFFEDDFLDFIYYDGYDYNFNTLNSWFLKLKQNGILCGQGFGCHRTVDKILVRGRWIYQYSKEAIDAFIKHNDLQMNMMLDTRTEKEKAIGSFANKSWYVIKR